MPPKPPNSDIDDKPSQKAEVPKAKVDAAFANLAREYNTPGTEPQRATDTQALNQMLQTSGLLPGLTIDNLQSSKSGDASAPENVTMHTNNPVNEGTIKGQPTYDQSTHTLAFDRTSVLPGTKVGTDESVTINMLTGQETVDAAGENGTRRKTTRDYVGAPNPTTKVTDQNGKLLQTEATDAAGQLTVTKAPGSDLINGHFDPSEISASGVDQTGLGDCWFQSAAASMASSQKGREQISQMIVGNSDGSYTVTFPGDRDHPVTVSDQEVNKNEKINDSAQWSKVLEAAILKKDPAHSASGAGSINGDYIFDNSGTKDSLQLLTGQNVNQDTIFTNSDRSRIAFTILQSIQSGSPITATTTSDAVSPIESKHVYSVIGCDPKTGMVTLRNPWGSNGDTQPGTEKNGVTVMEDGNISMPMDTFLSNYNYLQYGGQPKSELQQVGQVLSNIGNLLNPFNS